MKTLHYVLIVQHLTGDSEVKFFDSKPKAKEFFNEKVDPLLDICDRNGLNEDEVFSYENEGIRFNAGHDGELDGMLGDCDHWLFIGEIDIEDDVTHYLARFSEWVDESSIEFFGEVKAKELWNEIVEKEIRDESERLLRQGVDIDRNDVNTWENEDGTTLYKEEHTELYSDAYFGTYAAETWTHRVGKIILQN